VALDRLDQAALATRFGVALDRGGARADQHLAGIKPRSRRSALRASLSRPPLGRVSLGRNDVGRRSSRDAGP